MRKLWRLHQMQSKVFDLIDGRAIAYLTQSDTEVNSTKPSERQYQNRSSTKDMSSSEGRQLEMPMMSQKYVELSETQDMKHSE